MIILYVKFALRLKYNVDKTIFYVIFQDKVDDGIPLNICLVKFTQWLARLKQEKGLVYNDLSQPMLKLCTFVTWSGNVSGYQP